MNIRNIGERVGSTFSAITSVQSSIKAAVAALLLTTGSQTIQADSKKAPASSASSTSITSEYPHKDSHLWLVNNSGELVMVDWWNVTGKDTIALEQKDINTIATQGNVATLVERRGNTEHFYTVYKFDWSNEIIFSPIAQARGLSSDSKSMFFEAGRDVQINASSDSKELRRNTILNHPEIHTDIARTVKSIRDRQDDYQEDYQRAIVLNQMEKLSNDISRLRNSIRDHENALDKLPKDYIAKQKLERDVQCILLLGHFLDTYKNNTNSDAFRKEVAELTNQYYDDRSGFSRTNLKLIQNATILRSLDNTATVDAWQKTAQVVVDKLQKDLAKQKEQWQSEFDELENQHNTLSSQLEGEIEVERYNERQYRIKTARREIASTKKQVEYYMNFFKGEGVVSKIDIIGNPEMDREYEEDIKKIINEKFKQKELPNVPADTTTPAPRVTSDSSSINIAGRTYKLVLRYDYKDDGLKYPGRFELTGKWWRRNTTKTQSFNSKEQIKVALENIVTRLKRYQLDYIAKTDMADNLDRYEYVAGRISDHERALVEIETLGKALNAITPRYEYLDTQMSYIKNIEHFSKDALTDIDDQQFFLERITQETWWIAEEKKQMEDKEDLHYQYKRYTDKYARKIEVEDIPFLSESQIADIIKKATSQTYNGSGRIHYSADEDTKIIEDLYKVFGAHHFSPQLHFAKLGKKEYPLMVFGSIYVGGSIYTTEPQIVFGRVVWDRTFAGGKTLTPMAKVRTDMQNLLNEHIKLNTDGYLQLGKNSRYYQGQFGRVFSSTTNRGRENLFTWMHPAEYSARSSSDIVAKQMLYDRELLEEQSYRYGDVTYTITRFKGLRHAPKENIEPNANIANLYNSYTSPEKQPNWYDHYQVAIKWPNKKTTTTNIFSEQDLPFSTTGNLDNALSSIKNAIITLVDIEGSYGDRTEEVIEKEQEERREKEREQYFNDLHAYVDALGLNTHEWIPANEQNGIVYRPSAAYGTEEYHEKPYTTYIKLHTGLEDGGAIATVWVEYGLDEEDIKVTEKIDIYSEDDIVNRVNLLESYTENFLLKTNADIIDSNTSEIDFTNFFDALEKLYPGLYNKDSYLFTVLHSFTGDFEQLDVSPQIREEAKYILKTGSTLHIQKSDRIYTFAINASNITVSEYDLGSWENIIMEFSLSSKSVLRAHFTKENDIALFKDGEVLLPFGTIDIATEFEKKNGWDSTKFVFLPKSQQEKYFYTLMEKYKYTLQSAAENEGKGLISPALISAILWDELVGSGKNNWNWYSIADLLEDSSLNNSGMISKIGDFLQESRAKSIGPAQIWEAALMDLIKFGYADWYQNISNNISHRDVRLNFEYSIKLMAGRLAQTVEHWDIPWGAKLEHVDGILGTLYSINLTGDSGVHNNPQSNNRGEAIAKKAQEINDAFFEGQYEQKEVQPISK